MPVPTRIYDLSATASSNSPAGSDTVGTTWDDYLRAIQSVLRGDLATKGADIASASTTDLGAVQGLAHDITGTVAITSFGTVAAGIPKIVKYEGVLTLTHNATSLILLTGANRTTADGDVGLYISEGSGNWREIIYAYAGALTMDTHPIVMGSADRTKKVRLEVDGLTTATTRVITVQDKDFTIGKNPTRQSFTSGSGTYTTPSGATRLYVRLVGGGGGGGGVGTSGAGNGGAGGNTTFSTLTGNGGGVGTAGASGSNGTAGAGGTASGGSINLSGGNGSGTDGVQGGSGGHGGSSFFGGNGGGGAGPAGAGTAGITNTGGGGGGAGGQGAAFYGGGGGGAGGFAEAIITSPSATYSYGVGAAGSAGGAGVAGAAGGAGGSGLVIVDEWYD